MNRLKERIQEMLLFLSDAISVVISFYLSSYLWLVVWKKFDVAYFDEFTEANITEYILVYIITTIIYSGTKNYISRGKFQEIVVVFKKFLLMAGIMAVYELLTTQRNIFSRGTYVLAITLTIVISLTLRYIIKAYLIRNSAKYSEKSRMILITTSCRVGKTLELITDEDNWLRKITGIVIIDKDMTKESINGVPVVADAQTMVRYIKNEVVDEVFLDIEDNDLSAEKELLLELEDMGVTVHVNIEVLKEFEDFAVVYGHLGDAPVMTFARRFYDNKQLAVKRLFDIIGAIVGLMLTFAIGIVVAPLIKLESKGPLFFKQKRVGKNGRYFYIYKFRSMYVDAEERKKELMSQNEMSGLMFKMKNDPRITRMGRFIRKTSIDELPQFFNVLKGDMSLVGTRPPTVNEFKQYEGHHKRRLSMKPGITGMWQAYGRNKVMDFEKVVKMDLQYIDNWSLGLDLKILLKTVQTVLTNSGQ